MIQIVDQQDALIDEDYCRQEPSVDSCDVWAFEGCWHRIQSGCSDSRPLSLEHNLTLLDQLEEVRSSQQSVTWRIDSARKALLQPMHMGHVSAVRVQWIDSESDQSRSETNELQQELETWKQRALQAESALQEKSSQLNLFHSRILDDQRELAWLKELARNAELSDTTDHTERVAENILPDLCGLLHARTVVFVREASLQMEESGLPLIWQSGEQSLERDICISLVQELAGCRTTQTVVRNFDVPQYRDTNFSGILSVILVPVNSANLHVGWLIAINKDLRHLVNDEASSMRRMWASDQSCEFGDFDLSLMQAAATVLASHAHNCRLFHQQEELLTGVIRSLVNTLDAKDSYTCGHSDRVAETARLIAAQMDQDVEFCEQIYMTGLLHDVGKIGVPDEVLNKPGRLTDDEFDLIKQHPVIGHEILSHLSNFSYVLPGVLHHHESFDGSGYPHGLSQTDIPLDARILAVADAYDAMTSDRPYRQGMESDRAEAILRDGAGSQWDPDCVSAFLKCVDGIRLLTDRSSADDQITNRI